VHGIIEVTLPPKAPPKGLEINTAETVKGTNRAAKAKRIAIDFIRVIILLMPISANLRETVPRGGIPV